MVCDPAAVGNPEGHELALVVDEQTEREAQEPVHGGVTTLGQPWEDPVAALIPALWQRANLVLAAK